jgi:Luciferase-like monooxygenase
MKLGLHVAATNWQGGASRLGATLGEVVAAAEAAGFDLISLTDHVWGSQYTGGVGASQVEAYTTLGFVAAHTRRVRLLALATAAPYRPAGLLAKIVTTLDVLSGGRAVLGIGAGDYAEEAEGLGLPFPSTATPATSHRAPTCRASSSCCGASATRPGATTPRSRRPCRSRSTWARTARRWATCSASCAGWPAWAPRPSSAGS